MSRPAAKSPSGRWLPLQAAVIVLAAAWIYAPTLRGGWLWDDGLEITQNSAVQSAGGWLTPWYAPVGMDYFPLKSSVQWLEWHLWGSHVAGYHLVNLALHLLSAFLVWRLLARLGVGLAWVGGLLFAVHPVAVESVAWIAEFKNTLSLPLLLGASIAWVDYDRTARRGDRWRSLCWFTVAMLCKSSVVMFPAVLLLFAWWRRGRISGSDGRATAPFWLVSAGLGLVTVWFQSHRAIGATGPVAGWTTRLGQAGGSLLHYAGDCLVPWHLAPVYPPVVSGWLAWPVVVAVLAVLWAKRAGWGRPVLLGGGWFLLNLLPVLGLIPLAYLRVSPVADHLAYLPLVGCAGLGAAALGAAQTAWARQARIIGAAAAVVIAGFIWSAHGYAAIFRSEETLWSYAAARNPAAWLARNNLGRTELQAGRAEEALAEFREAIRLQPDSAEAQANAGAALERLGRGVEAEGCYREAVRLDPGFAGAHYDLGHFLLRSGRPFEAADEFRAALRLDPQLATAHNNLGLALARLGRSADARLEYQEALRLEPRLPEALVNLGNDAFRTGRVNEAVSYYRAALKIDPSYAAAHQNLAAALERQGQSAEARLELQAAQRGAQP